MRISCKKLAEILKTLDKQVTPRYLRAYCEAYGRDVRCYVNFGNNKKKKEAELKLRRLGVDCNTSYNKYGATVEIKVKYFKAHHWNE